MYKMSIAIRRSFVVFQKGKLSSLWQASWRFCSNDTGEGEAGASASGNSSSKAAVLSAALPFVPQHGWSRQAVVEGSKVAGIPLAGLSGIGAGDLVGFFEEKSNDEVVQYMKQQLESQEEDKKGKTKLIRLSIEHRLRMITPYLHKWPQAMALKALPSNAAASLERMALLVDDMWYWAGDRSADFNWYTKRAVLAGVYCSTELHMVQDESPDLTETWQFLDRRLSDAASFAKTSKQVQDVAYGAGEWAAGGLQVLQNILGLNRNQKRD